MKITVDVQKAAKKNGLLRANQLGVRAGLAPGVASKWWKAHRMARIELSVLERICVACNCSITDILTAHR